MNLRHNDKFERQSDTVIGRGDTPDLLGTRVNFFVAASTFSSIVNIIDARLRLRMNERVLGSHILWHVS